MATDIGPLTAKMVASAEGMKPGLAEAEKLVKDSTGKMSDDTKKSGDKAGKGWAKSFSDGTKGLLRGGFNAGAWLGNSLQKSFGDPVRDVVEMTLDWPAKLANKIPVIGPLLAMPFEAAKGSVDFLLDSFDKGSVRIKELGKAAGMVAMDVGDYAILRKTFELFGGGEAAPDAVTKALFKFQQQLANSATAAEGTRTAFSGLGIDGKQLAELAKTDMLGAWGKFADRVGQMPSAAMQAKAAFDVLGKSGYALLPLLLKGSAEVDKMKERFARYGLGVSGGDLASVRAAGLAKKEISMLKEGFVNQLTIGVAPFVAELSSRLSQVKVGFGGLAAKIIDWLGEMATAVAFFIDAWGNPEQFWGGMAAYASKFGAVVLEVMANVGDAIVTTFGSSIAAVRKQIGVLALATGQLGLANALEEMGKIPDADLFGGLREKAGNMRLGADANLAKWKAEIQGGESGWWALRMMNPQTTLGKVDAFMTAVRARFAEKGKAVGDDAFAAWIERTNALSDKLESPFEKWGKDLREVLGILKAGEEAKKRMEASDKSSTWLSWASDKGFNPVDLLAPDLAGKAGFALLGQLQAAVGGSTVSSAAAALQGSKEAYSTIVKDRARGQRQDIQQQMLQLMEEAKRQADEQIRIGREVIDALKKNPQILIQGNI